MKEVGGTVLAVFNKKTTLNHKSRFILDEYDLCDGTRKRKYPKICSLLKVMNHLQYLVKILN